MKPSIQLIEALRRAATRIEDPNGGYAWEDPVRCNCGIVAQELLSTSQDHLEEIINRADMCVWSESVCATTGRPTAIITRELVDAGLSVLDIIGLENLSCAEIRERAGLRCNNPAFNTATSHTCYDDYDHAETVVAYLRAWADILEEELTNLRQCGVESRHATAELGRLRKGETKLCGGTGVDQSTHSPSSAGPLPQSPSQPVACVHIFLECGVCMICSATKPVQQKELV